MAMKKYEIGIAVDFGMTGSAVAWNMAGYSEVINFIGAEGTERNGVKIPTRVAADQFGTVLSWGFQCGENDPNTKQLFKVWLDETFIRSHDRTWLPRENQQRSYESEEWTFFYIRALIKHSIISIGKTICERFDTANIGLQLQIHYILSTPTTWGEPAMRTFRGLVKRAIDGAHKFPEIKANAASLSYLDFNITEPEAVANLVLDKMPDFFDDGDIFIALDVGGSTADPFITRIAKKHGHYICLPQDIAFTVPGVSRGCLDIGQSFQFVAWNRLAAANIPDPYGVSCQMREGRDFKVLMRTYPGSTNPKESIYVPIPGLETAVLNNTSGIFRSMMKFSTEFNAIFDDALLERLKACMSTAVSLLSKPPKYIALAGGGSKLKYTAANLKHIAPVIAASSETAVAEGCLLKWKKQLLMMTIITQDIPFQKLLVGTSQREAGQEFATLTWQKSTNGKDVTASCVVHFPLVQGPSYFFEVTIETERLPPLPYIKYEPQGRRKAEFRINIRLPTIAPFLTCEDFTTYTTDGVQVDCSVTSAEVDIKDVFPTSPT